MSAQQQGCDRPVQSGMSPVTNNVPFAVQRGARMGENSGGDGGNGARALDLPLGQGDVGERQI